MEHIKKLYVSHSVKEVKDYVSEVSGIIAFLHFSKDALSAKGVFLLHQYIYFNIFIKIKYYDKELKTHMILLLT
ncbi:hypothetical protein ANANG_G00004160, partial [Anguilla anguilla]